jgi:hypothetical protein
MEQRRPVVAAPSPLADAQPSTPVEEVRNGLVFVLPETEASEPEGAEGAAPLL